MSIQHGPRRQHLGRRHESGASLVEFALIFPVFALLLFGMISGGIALSQQNAVKNAVREASRHAAVSPGGGTPAYLNDVVAQVEAAASGDIDDSVPGKQICVSFLADDGRWDVVRKTGASSVLQTDQASGCFADTLGTPLRTQVLATRSSEIEGVIVRFPLTITAKSVSRYER